MQNLMPWLEVRPFGPVDGGDDRLKRRFLEDAVGGPPEPLPQEALLEAAQLARDGDHHRAGAGLLEEDLQRDASILPTRRADVRDLAVRLHVVEEVVLAGGEDLELGRDLLLPLAGDVDLVAGVD